MCSYSHDLSRNSDERSVDITCVYKKVLGGCEVGSTRHSSGEGCQHGDSEYCSSGFARANFLVGKFSRT